MTSRKQSQDGRCRPHPVGSTGNVNGLETSVMNANTAVCCVRETHCKRKGIDRVNVNEWKTIYHAYANCAKPNWLNEHRNRRIHKTGSVLPTNSMYFTFMQSSAQTDRQTNRIRIIVIWAGTGTPTARRSLDPTFGWHTSRGRDRVCVIRQQSFPSGTDAEQGSF